jgi:hypothetical protein
VDPIAKPISDYGRGRLGWMFAVALLGLSAAFAGVGFSLATQHNGVLRIAGYVLLLDAAATAVLALAPTDLAGESTVTGRIHQAAATVAFLTTTAGFLTAAIALPREEVAARWLLGVAVASLVFLLAFFVAIQTGRLVGATERAHVGATVVWLGLAAGWSSFP